MPGSPSPSSGKWAIERLVLYVSGRAEATFSDGSAVILHPPTAAKATFFGPDGRRQRLLSTCSPQYGATDLRAKIMAAAAVRDQFHPYPSSLQPAELCQSFTKPTCVVWPSHVEAAEAHEDGSVEVSSLDGSARVLLAPHGRTFAVQWLRATGSSTVRLQEVQAEKAETADAEDGLEGPGPRRLFRSSDRAAGILHECVKQVQCFAVESLEWVEVAWVHPLLIALLRQSCESGQSVGVIQGLAEKLRQCLASGQVLDGGTCVTVPLPEFRDGASHHSSDSISPAARMGTFGEGPVMLSWTPLSTIRMGQNEASVEAFDDGQCQWAFLESSLKGGFWKLVSANMEWELPDILCADLLPPGDSAFSCRLISLVQEAVSWLRQNDCEGPAGPGCPGCPGWVPVKSDIGQFVGGWLHEAELADAFAQLTVFRWGERRRARVLFAKGARMEFEAQNASELGKAGNIHSTRKIGGQVAVCFFC